MALCRSCNTENGDDVQFCTSCGSPLGGSGVGQTAGGGSSAKGGTSEVKRLFKRFDAADGSSEKSDLIESFVLPNDKEELLEFVTTAYDKLEYIKGELEQGPLAYVNNALFVKIQKAYDKAIVDWSHDDPALAQVTRIINKINAERTKFNEETAVNTAKKKKTIRKVVVIVIVVITLLSSIPWVVLGAIGSGEKKAEAELNTLYEQVLDLIEDGEFTRARRMAGNLRWTRDSFWGGTEDKVRFWDERRQTLLGEIEAAESRE